MNILGKGSKKSMAGGTGTGCCGVINWPSLNVAVPQGIGKPKKREIEEEWPGCGAVRMHITFTD